VEPLVPFLSEPSDREQFVPPAWLPALLTALLVIPCGSIAVLFMLQIEVIHDPLSRRLIASAAACLVPIVLFLLRVVEDTIAGGRRVSPPWFWLVWLLATVALVAVPIAARLGLGTRPAASGVARGVRDLRVPPGSDLIVAVAAGIGVAVLFASAGLIVARMGTAATVLAAVVAVGIGFATVPITFVGLALTYDVVVGPGDDPLADTAQTLSIVWFVAAPMAGLLTGLSAAWSRRPR